MVVQEEVRILSGIPDVLDRIEDHHLGLPAKDVLKKGALTDLPRPRDHDDREVPGQGLDARREKTGNIHAFNLVTPSPIRKASPTSNQKTIALHTSNSRLLSVFQIDGINLPQGLGHVLPIREQLPGELFL